MDQPKRTKSKKGSKKRPAGKGKGNVSKVPEGMPAMKPEILVEGARRPARDPARARNPIKGEEFFLDKELSAAAIKRLSVHAGVEILAGASYGAIREVANRLIKDVSTQAGHLAVSSQRKTVKREDIEYAMQRSRMYKLYLQTESLGHCAATARDARTRADECLHFQKAPFARLVKTLTQKSHQNPTHDMMWRRDALQGLQQLVEGQLLQLLVVAGELARNVAKRKTVSENDIEMAYQTTFQKPPCPSV